MSSSSRCRSRVARNTGAPVTIEGTRACPGVLGGVQWNGPAYNPGLDMLYTPAVDWCGVFSRAEEFDGRRWMGGGYRGDDWDDARGRVTAVDATSGRVVWSYDSPHPMLAAITTTSAELLFTGELTGDFLVLDARDGSVLLALPHRHAQQRRGCDLRHRRQAVRGVHGGQHQRALADRAEGAGPGRHLRPAVTVGLPDRARRIVGDVFVGRDDGEPVNDRLADEHSVERVLVHVGQTRAVKRGGFIQEQRFDAVRLSPSGYPAVGGLIKGQTAPLPLLAKLER